jgi:hypothetical protein
MGQFYNGLLGKGRYQIARQMVFNAKPIGGLFIGMGASSDTSRR